MLKNQKGITLIALVITIIVLLILAGVSIAMLTGDNGLLTRANDAKVETAIAEALDRANTEAQAQLANVLSGKAFDEEATINANLMTTEKEGVSNTLTYVADASITITVNIPTGTKALTKNSAKVEKVNDKWTMTLAQR